MTDNTTYKVVRLTTEGWTLADDQAVNLTKEQCDEFLRNQVEYEGPTMVMDTIVTKSQIEIPKLLASFPN